MINFVFDKEKAIASLLFILERLGKCDLHKLSKILYYGDQKHLAKYGSPITGDNYIAMKNGPVPSSTYDLLKELKNSVRTNLKEVFEINGYTISAKIKPDTDILSESEIECLLSSIDENKLLGFDELTRKSHSTAWNSANKNDEMSFIEIAKEGGANGAMISYIKTVSDNLRLFA